MKRDPRHARPDPFRVFVSRILLIATLALASAPHAAASGPPPPAAPVSAPRVTRARLHVDGTSAEAFGSALALRLPGVELVPHDRVVAPTSGLDVFVDLRAVTPQSFAVTIVTADGRAFDRTVDAEPGASSDDVTRLLASHVGNLVAGIEAGTVEPDRRDVPMPVVAPTPVPDCPACPEPPPVTAAPSAPPPLPPAKVEVGIHGGVGVVLGLGAPTDTDRFSAWGGDLGMKLRSRQGVVALLEARVGGRETAYEQRLLRTRVGLGIGYAWRGEQAAARGGVEIEIVALATVEPWWLRSEGENATFTDDRANRPLLGGALRFVPGWLAHPSPRVRVRVGPKLELAFSSAIGDGGRVIQLVVDDGTRNVPIGRLAGLELDLGIELTLWFDPRAAITRPSSPRPRSAAALRPRPARAAAVPRRATHARLRRSARPGSAPARPRTCRARRG
jgi:hypothetical protein